jgi:hypothetical protein
VRIFSITGASRIAAMIFRQRGYRAMGYLVAEEAISDDGTSPADAGRTSTYRTRNSSFQVEII